MERLKELRRERVLSLRELEEKSGVSYNTIWRLEDGEDRGRNPEAVGKMAKAIEVEPSELREGSEGTMGKVKQSGNGTGTVYPRRNKEGKITHYSGLLLRYHRQAPVCESAKKNTRRGGRYRGRWTPADSHLVWTHAC